MTQPPFPLDGVIGIIANGSSEIDQAKRIGLQCVEIRPDLLLDRGFTLNEIMSMVGDIASIGLRCLFTLRRHDHGGKFRGSDHEQMEICMQALSSGADIIDIEWDSKCAQEIVSTGVNTILSYHNFSGMPSPDELASITEHITCLKPTAIKLIPTANSLEDSVRILRWVSGAGHSLLRNGPLRNDPLRIGFAMGKIGEYSRILSRTFGSPITYAGFDKSIAPGQIAVKQLLTDYHAHTLHDETRVIGVVGENQNMEQNQSTDGWIKKINCSVRAQNNRLIAVPIQLGTREPWESDSVNHHLGSHLGNHPGKHRVSELEILKTNAEFLRMDYLVSPQIRPRLIRLSANRGL